MKKIVALVLLGIGSGIAAMAVSASPEIDAASGGSAIALLAGAVLIFRGRRRS